jgi:hypothetical protein
MFNATISKPLSNQLIRTAESPYMELRGAVKINSIHPKFAVTDVNLDTTRHMLSSDWLKTHPDHRPWLTNRGGRMLLMTVYLYFIHLFYLPLKLCLTHYY